MHANTRLSDHATVKNIKVGDIVTSEFYEGDEQIKREVTEVEHGADTGSTVRIWASDGGMCECCNRPLSKPINGVDGAWFIPA